MHTSSLCIEALEFWTKTRKNEILKSFLKMMLETIAIIFPLDSVLHTYFVYYSVNPLQYKN